MKKKFSKLLSILLVMSFVLSYITISVDATQSRSGNFSSVTLTGNPQDDIVLVAQAQNGRYQSSMGYTEAWCADFTSDCAKIIGQGNAVPFHGGVSGLYSNIINAGGYVVNSPQRGDIAFFGNYAHVGIMVNSTECISGNMWIDGISRVYQCSYKIMNPKISIFVRPNYSRKAPITHKHTGYVCPDDGYWEPLAETAISGNNQSYIVSQGGTDIFDAPYTSAKKSRSLGTNTPVTCIASVVNKQGQQWFKLGGSYNGKWLQASKATWHPASDIAMYLALKDNPMTEGKTNSVLGNVNSSYYSMSITAYLDGKQYCNYKVSKGNQLFQDSEITRGIDFESLEPGDHTIRVVATDEGGGSQDKSLTFNIIPAVSKPKITSTKTVGGDERTNEVGGKLITLGCTTGGASIYYTLDGTEPTQSSTQYTVPFKVSESATIRVRAFLNDKKSAIFTDSIIISQATAPSIVSEDTPDGARITISGEDNATTYYRVKGVSNDYIKYKKPFTLTEDATVEAYSRKSGCKDSEFVSTDIEVKVPEKPVFVSPNTNVKYAQNSVVTFRWNDISNAKDYSINVYLDDELQDTLIVTDANASICLEEAGTYSIKVTARNVIGNSEESDEITAISMAPLTVTYEDYDGSIISEQVVDYGTDAVEPVEEPNKKGYFFLYWDGSNKNITKDTQIKAVYRIRSYDVEFYDQNNNLLGYKQIVEFNGSADVPEIDTSDLPEGFVFLGWNIQPSDSDSNCDLSRIDSDMKVTAIVGWFNSELPLITEITSASRDDDSYSEGSNENGNYVVNVRVKNYPDKYTTALLRVSLKTAEDKMVKTESRTIGLRPDAEDEYEFVLNYSGTATKVEAVALGYDGDYKTGSALSEISEKNIQVQSGYIFNDWSEWSENIPQAQDGRVIESRTIYRSRTKQTKTLQASTLDGWTVESSDWVQTGSGTHYYFPRPNGFNGNAYTNYANGGLSPYETATNKRVISGTSHNSYIYWKWSCPYTYGQNDGNCFFGEYYGEWVNSRYGNATVWETFESVNGVEYQWNSDGTCRVSGRSRYGCNWRRHESYKQSYTDYVKNTTFYKYTDWSNWQEEKIEATNGVEVETITQYRYKDKDIPQYSDITGTEDTSGESYHFEGSLPVDSEFDLSGKLATVMVYKGKNSDPNESQLQYVGQITIGENNSYDLTFKTKDAPTISSGDYIVSLGVQGATGLVNVAMITAPKPTYTVNYYSESTLVDSQEVEEGDNATLPEAPEKEGYKFIAWSETGRNVHGDLNITAIYTPITYAVAFVDWVNGTATPFALEYGADISAIADEMVPVADGHTFLYWDEIEAGNTTVTGNMIISAVYEAQTYTVNFYDGEGEDKVLIDTQKVEYGKAAELPEDPTYEDKMFIGWSTDVKWWNVKSDMDVYPILAYNENAGSPISPEGSYIYGMNDSITLMAAEGAQIYYTTDGTDPEPGENGVLYTGPISVDNQSVVIKAVAVEENKNNSEIVDIYFDYSEGEDYETYNDRTVIQKYNPIVSGGDSISLNLNIKNNPGLEGYLFFVECDPNVYYLDYIEGTGYDYEAGELTEDGTYFVVPDENGWKVMWFNTEAAEGDGNLFTLNLKVAEGVASGSYPISVSYSGENMIVPSNDEEFDEFDTEFEGTISGATIVGDVDGDNELTLADVITIAKHVAKISFISDDISKINAADVNRDGNINLPDVIKLARFIVGLESSLF